MVTSWLELRLTVRTSPIALITSHRVRALRCSALAQNFVAENAIADQRSTVTDVCMIRMQNKLRSSDRSWLNLHKREYSSGLCWKQLELNWQLLCNTWQANETE